MSEELLYTSAARGLKAGARGFCTVEATAGMPPTMAQLLESLSGYRHLRAPGDPNNPVVVRHLIASVGGAQSHVLSRIADAGLDYSGRNNKIAHHVALTRSELNQAGPAWSQTQDTTHKRAWSGETKTLANGRQVPEGDQPPAKCRAWEATVGDAGWAGVLAERVAAGSGSPLPIVVRADQDPLELIVEAVALLPPETRWRATYTTFHTQLPPGVQCVWRFVVDGTKEAEETLKRRDRDHLDLRQPLGPPPEGPWVEAARTGKRPALKPAPPIEATNALGADASPFEGEPGNYDLTTDDLGPGRPAPPPPAPRRKKRYGSRGDLSSHEPGTKRYVSPLMVTAIALLATAMIGLLVAATMIPWDRVAAYSDEIKEQSSVRRSDRTTETTTIERDESPSDADIKIEEPADLRTWDESSEFDEAQPVEQTAIPSDETILPSEQPEQTPLPGLETQAAAGADSIESPQIPTFFGGIKLLTSQEPTAARPKLVLKATAEEVLPSKISFVVPEKDYMNVTQELNDGLVSLRMKDRTGITEYPPFLTAKIRGNRIALERLKAPRPRYVEIIALQLAAIDKSAPETVQLIAPMKIDPLIRIHGTDLLAISELDRFIEQTWLIDAGRYTPLDDLAVYVNNQSFKPNSLVRLELRQSRKPTDGLIMRIRIEADSEEGLRSHAGAVKEWEDERHNKLSDVNEDISKLTNDQNPGEKDGAKNDSDLQDLREQSKLLEKTFADLLDYVAEASEADDKPVLRAIDSLAGDLPRFPNRDPKKWETLRGWRIAHKKITDEVRQLSGEIDLVITGSVLSDESTCRLVVATTRDIPEAPRDEQ